MSTYSLRYGRSEAHLEIDDRLLRAQLRPAEVPGLADVTAAVRASLSHPTGTPPLSEMLDGKHSALILTVDHTRPSPAPLLLPLLDVLHQARVRPTLCVATGRHRQMTPEELQRHFTPEVLARVRLVQHDPFAEGAFENLGRTGRGTGVVVNREVLKHDIVLGVGTIEPSYLAGFSGGRKLIMPGVAHHRSIDANHFLLTDPATRIGVLDGNPLSEDCGEFAARVPFHFICYSVVGPNDEIVGVFAGDPVAAHRLGCGMSRAIYEVAPVRAGIVVTTVGGYPYDCDLVQGKKGVVPAAALVEEGGAIVILAECAEGLGAEPTFLEWLRTRTPWQVREDVGRRDLFSLGAHGASILARPIVERKATVILVACPEVCAAMDGTFVQAVESLDLGWRLARDLSADPDSVVILHGARRLIVGS